MKQDTIESWRKYLNRALLTVIVAILSIGATSLNTTFINMNTKFDLMDAKFDVLDSRVSELVLISTINTERISHYRIDDVALNTRMTLLETGQHEATMDRITKTEVYTALENLKKWVDRYYERK